MFRTLVKIRNQVSRLIAITYHKTNWEPNICGDLLILRDFIALRYEWTSDPIWGLFDHIQPIKHMNWQLQNKGVIKGDCDDLATYTAYMLKRMGYEEIYRVNIPEHRHVICVFGDEDGYRFVSNSKMESFTHATWEAAAEMWCILNGKSKDVEFIKELL